MHVRHLSEGARAVYPHPMGDIEAVPDSSGERDQLAGKSGGAGNSADR